MIPRGGGERPEARAGAGGGLALRGREPRVELPDDAAHFASARHGRERARRVCGGGEVLVMLKSRRSASDFASGVPDDGTGRLAATTTRRESGCAPRVNRPRVVFHNTGVE